MKKCGQKTVGNHFVEKCGEIGLPKKISTSYQQQKINYLRMFLVCYPLFHMCWNNNEYLCGNEVEKECLSTFIACGKTS